MKIFKNYFFVFVVSYLVILFGKLLFLIKVGDGEFIQKLWAIFWGYKFDFAVSGIVAFLAGLFEFNKKFFILASSILITFVFLVQVSDILYFIESNRHIGYEVLDVFTDAKSLLDTAIFKYGWFFLLSMIFALLLFLILYFYFKNSLKKIEFKRYLYSRIFILILSVFFIRGMFQHIPLTPWQANQIGDTKLTPYAINGFYSAIYAIANTAKKLKMIKFSHPKNINLTSLYNDAKNDNNLPIIKSKPNIVFFFMESWSGVDLKPYGANYEATPQFDKILKKSLRVKFMVASGHRTTEGMFATLVSYPNPLGKSVAKTQLQDFKYKSIIDILDEKGYSSAFFQGTSKETSGTGSLAQSLGFRKSYGKRDVKKRIYEENYWGVHDADLYNFALQKLNGELKEPFVIGINGATTHDNKLPKGIKSIRFVKDEALNKELNAFHFADESLGKFIKEVKKKFPNTLFVLFADHCGGRIKGSLRNYIIPFAIYSKDIKAKYIDKIISQRDIAPTVLDIAVGNYKKLAPNFSGKSLISDSKFFADYFHSGVLGWIQKDNCLEINLATNKNKCYKIVKFNKKVTSCSDDFREMKKNALGFTFITQKLLFDGNISEFKEWRK